MFVLKLETENAAFGDGNKTSEIARILRTLAEVFRWHADDLDAFGKVYDINGAAVGSWEFTA